MGLFGSSKPNFQKMEAKKDIKGLIKALKDSNSTIRWQAAFHLGKVGDTGAVGPLIEALHDKEREVRDTAAQALGKIGEVKALEPLIEAVKDHRGIDGSAIRALEQIGKPAVGALIEVLQDTNYHWGTRSCAADALGRIGDVGAILPLIETLKDKQTQLSSLFTSIAWALTEVAGDEDRAALRHILVEAWKKALTFEKKVEILKILESLGWEPGDDMEKVHYLIAKKQWDELFVLRRQAVEALIEALDYADEVEVPENAAELLGKIRDTRAVKPLIFKLYDPDLKVRRRAAWALAEIADEEARGHLLDVLEKEKDKIVRSEAGRGLINIANRKLGEYRPQNW